MKVAFFSRKAAGRSRVSAVENPTVSVRATSLGPGDLEKAPGIGALGRLAGCGEARGHVGSRIAASCYGGLWAVANTVHGTVGGFLEGSSRAGGGQPKVSVRWQHVLPESYALRDGPVPRIAACASLVAVCQNSKVNLGPRRRFVASTGVRPRRIGPSGLALPRRPGGAETGQQGGQEGSQTNDLKSRLFDRWTIDGRRL